MSASTLLFAFRPVTGASSCARFTVAGFLLLLTLIAAAETTSAQSFSTPMTYSVGDNPNSGTAGDFNGDNKLDLAIGNVLNRNVSVLLNKGDGTFNNAVNYGVDFNPESLATADLNNDGKLDLAVGNFFGGATSTGNVSILLGNGNGTFQTAVNYDASSPISLRAVDLNGDGKIDLAAASWTTDKASVLLGNGDGTFQAVTTYSAGTQPRGISVADFNGDGKPDLAVTNLLSNNVSILLGNGNGTFQTALDSSTPGLIGIAASDLNGDGKQDLVVAAVSSNVVLVLLGNGNGSFQTPVSYVVGAEPQHLELADFNGDALTDVVVVNANSASFSVLRGNGDGTFQSAITHSARSGSFAPIVNDFDADSKPDLAVLSNSFDVVDVLLNSPTARGVATSATAGAQAAGVLIASFKDYDASKTAGSFTATIDWGDGTVASSGVVSANGSGGFNVNGTHTYAKEGIYNVSVRISDSSGNLATATAMATVADAPLTATGKTINPIRGIAFSSVVANFTDADPTGNLAEFSATINWGDGANSAGTITSDGSGGFDVSGSHTYSNAGSLPIVVTIQDVGGSTATANGMANVLDGGALAFSAATYSVAENGGVIAITITRNGGSAGTATVVFGTSNGTATAGQDYAAVTNQTVTFNDGDTSKTVDVPIINDSLDENDETVNLTLSNAGGSGALGSPATAVLTINDDDTPLIQFNAAYTIDEGAVNTPEGFASLTVQVDRSGDLSGASTVRYATSDLSGNNECTITNGNASQRCDYLMLSGTLRFAAGDASKTFQIPIVNDGYVEGPELFTIELSNVTGGTLGPASLTTVTITDDDTVATDAAHNPYLNNSFFVRMHYVDFLEREPDAAGFNDWVGVLDGCGTQHGFLGAPAGCDRAHISQGFFGATEFIDRGFLVYRFYDLGLNRLPLYTEFNADSAELRGFGLTPAEQEQNLDNYLLELGARTEFVNRYAAVAATGQASQLITLLETTAGVTLPATATTLPGQPPQYGRGELINKRATGQFSVVETVKAFAEQKVVYDKYFPRGFVTMQYFAYLHRDPDMAGWNDWVDVVVNGKPSAGIAPGDYPHLIFGFIYSTEYRKRFGQP